MPLNTSLRLAPELRIRGAGTAAVNGAGVGRGRRHPSQRRQAFGIDQWNQKQNPYADYLHTERHERGPGPAGKSGQC